MKGNVVEGEKKINFVLTPKGYFVGRCFYYGIAENVAEKLWGDLHAFVARAARDNGSKGFPALVFYKGGACLRVEKKEEDAAKA